MLTSSNQKSKKVAIMGCSHSDLHPNGHGYWTKFLCDCFPDIHFVNFSMGGTGNQLIELNFKYALYEDLTEYDCIIVQLSHHLRWQVPITGWSYDFYYGSTDVAYTDRSPDVPTPNMRKRNISVPMAYGSRFIDREILTNTIPNVHILNRGITRRYSAKGEKNQNWDIKTDKMKELHMSSNNIGTSHLNLASLNTKLFNRQLAHLAKDNSIFYFNWWPQAEEPEMRSNLGRPTVMSWWEENIGSWEVGKYIDQTHHLTIEANEILWKQYIKDTPLYKKLIDLSQ